MNAKLFTLFSQTVLPAAAVFSFLTPLRAQDPCPWSVQVSVSGLGVHANLVHPGAGTPPADIKWSLDLEPPIGTGPALTYTFAEPGLYNLCATYTWNGQECIDCESVVAGATGCIDPSLVNSLVLCSPEYDPVCGCNGVTYQNSCPAVYYGGVTSWTYGPCPDAGCAQLLPQFTYTAAGPMATLVEFTDQTSLTTGAILSRWWDFGDGNASTATDPQHNYLQPGFYTVCLTVTAVTSSGQTCEKTFCRDISVAGGCPQDCLFGIGFELDGVALQAQLQSLTQLPVIEPVTWTLDEAVQPATGPSFTHQFDQPGNYVLCATYSQLSGDTCTVCQAIAVTASCVDSARIDPNAICLAVYDPVCGCDGMTYGNACEAEFFHGITAWTPGECGSVCNDLFVDFTGFNSGGSLTYFSFYPTVIFPGGQVTSYSWNFGNGQTSTEEHPSLNFLEAGTYEVCLLVQATAAGGTACHALICDSVVVAGPFCVDPALIDTSAVCPAVYDPVCGCDGVTYGNSCEAENYGGVTAWTPGACLADCVQPALIDTLTGCSDVYDPVCGCDGVTYFNACEALKHNGVTSWRRGLCCENPVCEAFFTVTLLPNQTVLLTDFSVNAESWSLDFGDGSPLYGGAFDSLVHTYAGSGPFNLCLNISNFAGDCSDQYCVPISFTTAAPDPVRAIGMALAPNPASGQVQVKLQGAEARRVRLFDARGRLMLEEAVQGSHPEVSVTGLPAGLYWLEAETDHGRVGKKLMVW